MEEDTEEAIDKLEANLDVLTSDESSELEKGVALEQAFHNAKYAYKSFKHNE